MTGSDDRTSPITRIIEEERSRIEAALGRVLDGRSRELDPRLAQPIRYSVQAGGKRLRPLLCVRAYRAVVADEPPDALYDAACALELIHTYSLMHDDLPCMDDDDYRRGRPTAHRVYGSRAATLAGAAMIPLAAAVLDRAAAALGLGDGERAAAVTDLARGAGAAGMVGGQALDLAAERRTVSIRELEAIHTRKTGALFTCALRTGARLAGASDLVIDAFGRCGRGLGLAFQVTDDLLDVTGQTAVLGKTAGRDVEQGKATYPGLLGLEGARERGAQSAHEAVSALREAGIHDDVLEGLIDFAVNRDR
jgi:geranylgeranyl diphosphate synthase type II